MPLSAPPPDLPPQLRALLALQQANGRLSRRSVLRGAGAVGLGALLAACGTPGTGPAPAAAGPTTAAGPTPAQDVSDTEKKVDWANWTLYLDSTTRPRPTRRSRRSRRRRASTATYTEDIDGNDTYYGKIQGQLANGQDIGQDIITLTDWMAGRLIRLGYTQALDQANIPNADNLLPALAEGRLRPGPQALAHLAVRLRRARVEQGRGARAACARSSDLWKPELKGRVEVLDEMRDTMGLIMARRRASTSSGAWGDDEFGAAVEVLKKQIADGQIRQVKGNSYKEDLVSGDAIAVIGWSGDITQLNSENGDNGSSRSRRRAARCGATT